MRIEELIRRWQAADERLYPLVVAQPDAYERYLTLVRIVAEELRSLRTPEDLAEAFDRVDDVVARSVHRAGLPTEGLDVRLAAGAAFGLRYREIVGEAERAEIALRVQEAKERGDEWVVLSEKGNPDGASYLRVEMHLPDGGALQVSVEPDAESGRSRYALEPLQLDPHTGDWVGDEAAHAERATFSDRPACERAVADLRARIEGGSS